MKNELFFQKCLVDCTKRKPIETLNAAFHHWHAVWMRAVEQSKIKINYPKFTPVNKLRFICIKDGQMESLKRENSHVSYMFGLQDRRSGTAELELKTQPPNVGHT